MEKREKAIEIGKRLRTLRGEKTIAAVAEEIGIGLSAMLNYEAGIRIPNDETKVKLSRYYGVSVDELFYAQ